MKLTKTEREVAQLYQLGMKPREIAQKLGISINTVYKALSKARKAVEETLPQQPLSSNTTNLHAFNTTYIQSIYVINYQAMGQVDANNICGALLQKLEEILTHLKTESREVKQTMENREVKHIHRLNEGGANNGLDVLKKNAWISILRSKALTS